MAEDSHMVENWTLDHEELVSPPAFRFEIIGSFMDALPRHAFEAVKFENRGQGIINSKSEFKKHTGEKEMDRRERKLMTTSW
jgi:hypothetical protein